MKQLIDMKLLLWGVVMMLAAGCSRSTGNNYTPATDRDNVNSVYYWKTVFDADSAERAFLERHNVGRIYLRMFDVAVNDEAAWSKFSVVPNATVRIVDDYLNEPPRAEYVPVVYITIDALKKMNAQEEQYAGLIVDRVRNMCSYNRLDSVSELQLDCDWTESTRQSYFTLCRAVKQCIDRDSLGWMLSSTIRLHQLRESPPPVDLGVLMVYNTGDFSDPDADNSIIDLKDIEPYVKNLGSYPLHLDVAYPTYLWQLLYRKRRFAGILRDLDTSDTTRFAPHGANTHRVVTETIHGDRILQPGDIVRTELSPYETIIAVKRLIDSCLADRPHASIIYHLDSSNLSKYTDNEISAIYETAR